MNKKIYIAIIIVLMSITFSFADSVLPLINYQGTLKEPITGTKKLEFNIFDSKTGGNKIWGPQIFDNTPVINGNFNVILGSTDINGKSILSAFTSSSRFIGLKVDDVEIAQRQQVLSVPNSFNARYADRADEALHAVNADKANISNHSLTSDNANFSKNSSNAIYATRAGKADIEVDPTVPEYIKNGITWGEVNDKPPLKCMVCIQFYDRNTGQDTLPEECTPWEGGWSNWQTDNNNTDPNGARLKFECTY